MMLNEIRKSTPLMLLLTMVTITSVANIIGMPALVIDHWENTAFGEKFFPFDMDVSKKRILAGVMELSGLIMMTDSKVRKYGTGLIAIMYTWGTIINLELEGWKTVMTGIGAAVAWLLASKEFSRKAKVS